MNRSRAGRPNRPSPEPTHQAQPLGDHGQPLLDDGTVDVRALVARWEAVDNRLAGPMRERTE